MVIKPIAKRYRSTVHEKTQWSISSAWHPEVGVEEIPCGEVFVVSEVFHTVRHGILESTFSPGKIKYYVLRSDGYKEVVVIDYIFTAYSKMVNSPTDNYECAEEISSNE